MLQHHAITVGPIGVVISFPPLWPTGNLLLISSCERVILVSFIPSTSRILSLTNRSYGTPAFKDNKCPSNPMPKPEY